MARYSLFMLKAPLNTNQSNAVKLNFVVCIKVDAGDHFGIFESRDC